MERLVYLPKSNRIWIFRNLDGDDSGYGLVIDNTGTIDIFLETSKGVITESVDKDEEFHLIGEL